jgi:phosphotransferase system IIB component
MPRCVSRLRVRFKTAELAIDAILVNSKMKEVISSATASRANRHAPHRP